MREKQTKKGARRNFGEENVPIESPRQHELWARVYSETPSLRDKGCEDGFVQTNRKDAGACCWNPSATIEGKRVEKGSRVLGQGGRDVGRV